MIDTSTYSNFWDYVHEQPLTNQLFFFVNLNDDHFWTDGSKTGSISSNTYYPIGMKMTPVQMRANLHSGTYSIGQVKLTLQNNERGALSGTTRISEIFTSSAEFISKPITIYLGRFKSDGSVDYIPFYKGKIGDVQYGLLNIIFAIYDPALIDLPDIPTGSFDRSTYDAIPAELIDVPIPICYGRWDYEEMHSNKFKILTAIPGTIVENDIDNTTPELTLKFANHAIDAIRDILIYDPARLAYGVVQDSVSNTLGTAQSVISLFDHDAQNYLTAQFYLYPDRPHNTQIQVLNEENALDNSFDSFSTLNDQGSPLYSYTLLHLPAVQPFGRDELFPDMEDTTGETTAALANVKIEFSGYPSGSFGSGGQLLLKILNAGFEEILDQATVNALTDNDSFHYTTTANLQVCNPRIYNGSNGLFELEENGSSAVAIVPDEGIYPTMSELADEISKKISDGSFSNTYTVRYVKENNRIQLTRESGSVTFRLNTDTYSSDVGLTSSTSFATTVLTGNTILDVPDGDFSYVVLQVWAQSQASPEEDFYLKAIRIRYDRYYREYTAVLPTEHRVLSFFGGGSTTGRPAAGRQSTDPTTDRNGRYIPGNVGREGFRGEIIPIIDNNTILGTISGSGFYALVDGAPTGATYFRKGPEIIQDVLENRADVSALVDTTKFSDANSDTQIGDLALYLAQRTSTRTVISELARFSLGFVFVTPEGKFGMKCVKSSYSSSDVDFTVYFRHLKKPIHNHVRFSRNNLFEVSTDLDFHHIFNWANGQYERKINKTVNTTADKQVDIQAKEMNCVYCVDETDAATIAEYYSGDGTLNSFGQFGKPRTIATFTTLDPQFHFAEMGDIIQFDSSDWDSRIKSFEDTLSDMYFMIIVKQASKREITISALEVYEEPPS